MSDMGTYYSDEQKIELLQAENARLREDIKRVRAETINEVIKAIQCQIDITPVEFNDAIEALLYAVEKICALAKDSEEVLK